MEELKKKHNSKIDNWKEIITLPILAALDHKFFEYQKADKLIKVTRKQLIGKNI